jgi:hypothetical protein
VEFNDETRPTFKFISSVMVNREKIPGYRKYNSKDISNDFQEKNAGSGVSG